MSEYVHDQACMNINDSKVRIQSDTSKKWKCSVCHVFQHEKKACVLNHIEAKHYPSQGHYCKFCGRFCRTVNALNSHKAKYHKLNLENKF